jgi:hypothetical protein
VGDEGCEGDACVGDEGCEGDACVGDEGCEGDACGGDEGCEGDACCVWGFLFFGINIFRLRFNFDVVCLL